MQQGPSIESPTDNTHTYLLFVCNTGVEGDDGTANKCFLQRVPQPSVQVSVLGYSHHLAFNVASALMAMPVQQVLLPASLAQLCL
jgi:hypothetical protein